MLRGRGILMWLLLLLFLLRPKDRIGDKMILRVIWPSDGGGGVKAQRASRNYFFLTLVYQLIAQEAWWRILYIAKVRIADGGGLSAAIPCGRHWAVGWRRIGNGTVIGLDQSTIYIAQHACIILIGRCMTACDKSTRCFGSDGSFHKTCCGGNSVYALWIGLLCGHLSRSTHGISKTKKQHKKMRHFYVIKITFQLTTRAARQIYVDDRRRSKFFSLGKWRKCLAIETPRSLCNTAAH